jgi:hypothetical protein
MNIATPLKFLHQSLVSYAWEAENEDQEQQGEDDQSRDSKDQRDERDERDERDDREEKESKGYDKDYLGKFTSFHIFSLEYNDWKSSAVAGLIPPHLETIVPPPKSNC